MEKKIKYIKKNKPKDGINIYDRLVVFEDKINQLVKAVNELKELAK